MRSGVERVGADSGSLFRDGAVTARNGGGAGARAGAETGGPRDRRDSRRFGVSREAGLDWDAMRRLHLVVGVVAIAVFVATGQFMRHHTPPIAALSDSDRLM